MLSERQRSSGVNFGDFLVYIAIGGAILGTFGGITAYFLKSGISSINAIIVTTLITIVGNYINNRIINKGGNSSYENR